MPNESPGQQPSYQPGAGETPPVTPPPYWQGQPGYEDASYAAGQPQAGPYPGNGYPYGQYPNGQYPNNQYANGPYQNPPYGGAAYPMTDTDRNLRLIAFIFMIVSLVSTCWAIIPLAWMIPMSVYSWRIYKGVRPNTTAFGVCTLIFASLVAGILLLCSTKDA